MHRRFHGRVAEVDEGAAVDVLITNRLWTAMGLDPSTTLHDLRWGEHYTGNGVDDFVWVFAGGEPPNDFLKKIGVAFGTLDVTAEAGREARLAFNADPVRV